MFKVNTPQGEKFIVQLVGPLSYAIGGMRVARGGTLTVSKRSRDYLVHKTSGAFADFDPTPAVPVDEYRMPQFGERVEEFDAADFDPRANPAMSQAAAIALAAQSGQFVDQNGDALQDPTEDDIASELSGVRATAPAQDLSERGDITGGDVRASMKSQGGQAKTVAKAAVVIKAKGRDATPAPIDTGAVPATTID